MRLLFVSNYYPPADRGGYEQWCAEVAGALAQRGHEVRVVTSNGRADAAAHARQHPSVTVDRVLNLEVEAGIASTLLRAGPRRRTLEGKNLTHLRRIVAEFQPDAALVWGMWNVPRSVPALLETLLADRVVYYLCDYWPILPSAWVQQLQVPSRRAVTGLPKRLLGAPILADLRRQPIAPLRLERVYCVSQAVRQAIVDAGIPLKRSGVIYGGTGLGEVTAAGTNSGSRRLKILYAGRLTPDKGVHTGIEALALIGSDALRETSLEIFGRGEADYEARLRTLVRQHRLEKHVTFHGSVARADMPRILAQHDTLLLLSEWAEPFARIVLEAMAAGVVVIGTTTGGTPELLRHGENGLAIPPGDSAALATQIRLLKENPLLRNHLAQAGRRTVESGFAFDRMVNEMEVLLKDLVAA